MILWILGLAFMAAAVTAVCMGHKNRKMYRAIDRMLDQVLNREAITVSDIQEGEISALAAKVIRIQEKMEADIHQAQEEKEQIKSLISNMSHQLKTPLANVCMYRELLEGQTNPDRQRNFHLKMKKQLEKIDWILASLFKMVRLEQGAISFEIGPSSLQQTLLSALSTVYEKAEKKDITIVTEPFEDFNVCHNSKWTAEAFVNILENALKYTGCGGQIQISVNRMELYTQIQFRDNGIGIRPEELTDIFKRFYRSRNVENQEGSGIGLYLSRLILEKEKGYITVKSEYGFGTCFAVFLQNCQN